MKGGNFIEEVETLSVEETAKILNVFPQYIRIGLQNGRFPFGVAVKREKSQHWNYLIIKSKLEKFVASETGKKSQMNLVKIFLRKGLNNG